MLILRFVVWMFLVGLMALGAGVVSGQTTSTGSGQAYPNKSIRIVTTQPANQTDFVTRLIAQGLISSLGQQVVVDNRGGAGGVIAAETVAKAPADGYTLLAYGQAIWLLPFMRKSVPYDPVRDLSPITMAVTAPNFLVVHPSVAANSVKELIALAKAKPGTLNYGGGNTGSSAHLAAVLFNNMAGINTVQVPYKGVADALNALIRGEVQLMFPAAIAVAPHLTSGKLKVLAVTSAEPLALFPGVPTMAASGMPGYEWKAPLGIFAPAKTPATLINRLNQEIVRALNRTDIKEKILNAGAEVVGSSPEMLAAAVKSDMTILGKLIKDAGIRED